MLSAIAVRMMMASAAMIDDAQEGFNAFLDKRRPTFTQRPS